LGQGCEAGIDFGSVGAELGTEHFFDVINAAVKA
jgi:hypothetical protein